MDDIFCYDFHVHVGNERDGLPPSAFLQALQRKDVCAAGMLDHVEFFIQDDNEWMTAFRAHAARNGLKLYDDSIDGLKALYRDLDKLRQGQEMLIALGLELREPGRVPEAFLELPEYFCNCFHLPPLSTRDTPGMRAAELIELFARKIAPARRPGIINHPFRDRLLEFSTLATSGSTPTSEEFLPRDEVARLVDAAGEHGLFVEINLTDLCYHAPCCYEFCLYATRLLVKLKAKLSIGSDSHRPPPLTVPNEVQRMLEDAGVEVAHFQPVVDAMRRSVSNPPAWLARRKSSPSGRQLATR